MTTHFSKEKENMNIDRLIEIIDFINDGKRDKIIMSMKEAFDLKEFLRGLKWKVNTSPT